MPIFKYREEITELNIFETTYLGKVPDISGHNPNE